MTVQAASILLIGSVALAGCFTPRERIETDVELEVMSAQVENGDCDGASEQGSACHVIRIRVENEDSSRATSLEADRWDAVVYQSSNWTAPTAISGPSKVDPEHSAEAEVKFLFPSDERIEIVRYQADWWSGPGPIFVPHY